MELNKTQIERQKKRRRMVIILVAVVAVLVAAVLAIRSWIRMPEVPDATVQLPEQNVDITEETPVGGRKQGVYTFLVAGRDVASGSTDTMLLLTYDTQAKTIYGLNLPRDTMMNVTTYSKRLNAVYSYNRGKDKQTQVQNGMAALKAAVADLTGITPDFYVLVEWEAIGELVDALGGVEFEVPFDMKYDDPYQDPPLHIDQKAGLRTLDGGDAMEVIRWRKNNDGSGGEGGDIARLSIQQDFLKAVVKKCLQPATVLKLNSLVEIFKENVETDLTVGNILAFAQQAIGMDPSTGVEFATAPLADSFRYNNAALVTLDPEGILEIVNSKMNPYHEDIGLEDLEIVVRGSDGYFSVTSGELAEGINDYAKQPASTSKPEPEPEPEPEPADPEVPGEEQPSEPEVPVDPEVPTEPERPADHETPELPGQPEPVLPDPEQPSPDPEVPVEQPGVTEPEAPGEEQPVSPDIPTDVQTEESEPAPEATEQAPVAILPTRPEPVKQVA